MTGKRPLDVVSYQAIVAARAGSRSNKADIPCPVCRPLRDGARAQRKVMRAWSLGGDRISLHCVHCGIEGYVVPDNGGRISTPAPAAKPIEDNDDAERRRRNAEAAERI
jgi:hypothetical protein